MTGRRGKFLNGLICAICCIAMATGVSGCGTGGGSGGSTAAAPGTGTGAGSGGGTEAAPPADAVSSRVPAGSGSALWAPASVEVRVEPYTVKKDLSNIENLSQFGSFTGEQREALSSDCFFCAPSDEIQLFHIYEKNQYLLIPSFITVDSVLQVYHVFFDYSLRMLEEQTLISAAERLTESQLARSAALYARVGNSRVKQAALANTAYFATAWLCLEKDLPSGLPEEAVAKAGAEYGLIRKQGGPQPSNLFPFKLDYSQYTPRGHYTRSKDFERYFRTMMWYGQAPFPLYTRNETGTARDEERTLQAMLMTYTLFLEGEKDDAVLWRNIYEPTAFYTGTSDDFTGLTYAPLLKKVFGGAPDPDTFSDRRALDRFYAEADRLPEPRIRARTASSGIPEGKQFRFMGQRYIPDSEILQRLVDPLLRPMPNGTDVMGVLGSDRAYGISTGVYGAEKLWPGYGQQFRILREEFSALPPETWQSNLYFGWMWTLKSLLSPPGKGYPSFMTGGAWTDKSLATALGSWTELRHDTVLYAKQSAAECGGDMPPVVKSYVEPNVELYGKLLRLTATSRENLGKRGILSGEMQNKMQQFENLLQFLITCSEKELRNEELTENEYINLLDYGGTLEHLTVQMAGGYKGWYEITSETDRDMALTADVHTVQASYLQEAVGRAAQIFVVVPIGGRLYLTRGAVMDYYEFTSDARLNDEAWQKMIRDGTQPARPEWVKSFMKGRKDSLPAPAKPYNSGC